MATNRTDPAGSTGSTGGSGKEIAVIGSNMVDLISYIRRMPREGETVEAPDFAMGCGGKGANQAVVASRLGSQVLMLTRSEKTSFSMSDLAIRSIAGPESTE